MLFNSHGFIFVFLPLTLALFHFLCCRGKPTYALSALVGASLVFYGWWEPKYLLLILASVFVNFGIGEAMLANDKRGRRALLWLGVSLNLGALAWFKYANFLLVSGNTILGTDIHMQRILLPLAISFFTFQQIAYLVDTCRSDTGERSFLRYALFVTFFPQLIAGPIVHHKEMLPQFTHNLSGLKLQNLIIGGTIFFLGLFKKVIIADGVSPYSDTVFMMAANGDAITFIESWTGALAYSLQLYFDFSGYSDMAIGLARLFGVKLPVNFNSPYKATNIIDFWRRWHMTLSRFLRDYLYFVLGGNRHGAVRTYSNLMIVMLLGGLWHGAGWTFVLWGGLHGFYLLVNHAWRNYRLRIFTSDNTNPRRVRKIGSIFGRLMAHALTLLAVVFAWVLFRAENLNVATNVYTGMLGLNGVALPVEWLHNHADLASTLSALGVSFQPLAYMGPLFTPLRDLVVISGMEMQVDSVGTITAFLSLTIPILFALVWPNTQQIMRNVDPALGVEHERSIHNDVGGNGSRSAQSLSQSLAWRINVPFAVLTAIIAAYACFGSTVVSQFLYFQF